MNLRGAGIFQGLNICFAMSNDSHILEKLGFSLEEKQPHLGGERRVFAAHKSVLFGRRKSDNMRVIIKISHHTEGILEIERERICRAALDTIRFAYGTFSSPEEILFTKKDDYAVQITRFIEQDKSFLERSTPEQFHFALKGLKAMEAAHATTYGHIRAIRGIFKTMNADDYIRTFDTLGQRVSQKFSETRQTLAKAFDEIAAHRDDVERYCGFLTHFDFTPQNIRISGETMYLLDHSSLRFGSKHESWARFINFMVLYNPELESALVRYMRDNRAEEEVASLRLMRIFRLGELIEHHVRVAEASQGHLQTLSKKRVVLWHHVLESVLNDTATSDTIISEYKAARDSLRSDEEKQRQVGLH
jgi:hypothetical protein